MTEHQSRMRTSALDVVRRHEAQALAALGSATGGEPLCRLDGARASVKELEGAAVALAKVRRELRHEVGPEAQSGGSGSAEEVIERIRAEWLQPRGAAERRPGWTGYVSGGVEALEALDEDLRSHAAAPVLEFGPPPVPRSLGLAGPPAVSKAAPPTLPGVAASSAGARWPRRRLVAAAALLVLLVVLVGTTAGWPVGDAPLWTALTGGTLVLAALALATFVPRPGQGWRPDLGCTPCGLMGWVLAVAGPWVALATAHDGGRAALGLALAGAALARRVTDPMTCDTSPRGGA